MVVMAFIIIAMICPESMRPEYFRHLTLEDGLSQTTVLSIAQDKFGRMWFGTKEGVNIYDGTSIKFFKGQIHEGDGNNKLWIGNNVKSIKMDSAGDVYLFIDNDIIKYGIDTGRFKKITNQGKVRSLGGYKGEIAFLSGDSIMQWNPQSDKARILFRIPSELHSVHLSFDSDNFYLASSNGLHIYDRKTHDHFTLLPDKNVYSRFISRDGTLWIATCDDGLYRYRFDDKTLTKASMPTSRTGAINGTQIRNIIEDQDGKIWYGSFSGLYRYDPATETTSKIDIPQNIEGLTHSSVYGLYCDRKGNIWAGTYYGGVNYFSPVRDKFLNFNYTGFVPEDLSKSIIKDIVSDREGNIWFATDGAGIWGLDSNWRVKENISSKTEGKALRQNNVRAMVYDSIRHKLYIGTHLGGLSIYDIERRSMLNLIDDTKFQFYPGKIIYNLKIYGDNLYISSSSGLSCMNLSTGYIKSIKTPVKPKIFDIDTSGNIYYSSSTGKGMYKILNPISSRPVIKKIAPEDNEIMTTSLCVIEGGVLRATLGHGLIYYSKGKTKGEIIDSGNSRLPDNYCYAVTRGSGDNVYVISGENIVRLNMNDRQMLTVSFSGIFSNSHIINGSSLYSLPKMGILIGSTKGITLLNPDDFEASSTNKWAPEIFFSRLIMQNRDIVPDKDNGILATALPDATQITLPSDNNDFSIIVGLSDYIASTGIPIIKYRMDGIDDKWHMASGNEIKYRRLPPGRYTLRARQPGENEISLSVVVSTPWYASWWAWIIYIIVLLAFISFIIYKTLTETRLRLLLRKEMNEKELIERVNQEKLIFFTDISHEFQTPLTLINSHIDNLLTRYQRHHKLKEGLLRIRNHSLQMSHMVTQLLDFRKFQQDKQKFHVGLHDANETLKEAAVSFTDYAVNRNIEYIIDTDENPLTGIYDPVLINRVLVNIISNAFKYTPDGGKICCTVKRGDSDELVFEVKDNGKGISEKDLPFIFDRFYNGNADETDLQGIDIHSTGIGLAFAKSIVDRHYGRIEAESKEGNGALFRVTLHTSFQAYADKENVIFDVEKAVSEPAPPLPYVPNEDSTEPVYDEKQNDTPLILFVEDNKELLENLCEFFSDYYRVAVASDGEDGLKKAKELTPDVIVSDVMMPRVKGTEMCQLIKSDVNLCHIPVILLSALHSTESKLEGLNTNADDYVTKPFESKLLLARVDNLLRLRRVLRKQFEQQPIQEVDMSNVNPLDRKLLQRTTEIIEKNIRNLNFDIPMLCREVAMSRSLFFNKFKSLTGMTPNAFIQNYRLKYAATLLKSQPHLTIAEVADKCGFETSIYFSRCFKKQYGIPPLIYRKGTIPV